MLQHAAAFEVQFLRGKFLKGETAPIHESPIGHGVFTYPEVAAAVKAVVKVREFRNEII